MALTLGGLAPVALAGSETYVKPTNTNPGDEFGEAVAVWGDTMVIGAPYEDSAATGVGGDQDDGAAIDAGAVYVFVRDGGEWLQEAYLKASDTQARDDFGSAVAIHEDTIVVGAPDEDGGPGDPLPQSGAAYVFVRSNGQWTQQARLAAPNADAGDRFGVAVAIHDDVILVGAPEEDSQVTGVSAPEPDSSLGNDTGAVYVFERNSGAWNDEAYLKMFPDSTLGARFGSSVSLDGNRIAVGAPFANNGVLGSGRVNTFRRSLGAWIVDTKFENPSPQPFEDYGAAVSISDKTLAIGAPRDSDEGAVTGFDTGAAYVHVLVNQSWVLQGTLEPFNSDPGDRFGEALEVSGDRIAVGSPFECSSATGSGSGGADDSACGAGAVYTWTRDGLFWEFETYQKATNTDADDHFGWSVGLWGGTLVVGAASEDGGSTTIDGGQADDGAPDAGAAYVFRPDALEGDPGSVSILGGGSQVLQLDGGIENAGATYWIFGSASGTAPALPVGSGLLLPLVPDAYFALTSNKPFLPAFTSFLSTFDEFGRAEAVFSVPASASLSLAGATLWHAYIAGPQLGIAGFTSNAVPVTLTL